jgi:L-ascorbate metabolism protein UlaG (beta-lactamase superfamily)
MQLTWLGQAGFVVEDDDARCLIDPFLAPGPRRLVQPPLEPEDLPAAQAIFVSHQHPDHFDLATLRRVLAVQGRARLVLPEPVVPLAIDAGIPELQIMGSRPGHWYEVEGIRFRALPAMHGVTLEDAYGYGPGGLVIPSYQGYVVEIGGRRLFHAGDSLAWPGLAERVRDLQVDVALLPINGRDAEREAAGTVGNMDHHEAAELAATAGCRILVPMHFGMFASNTVDPGLVVEAVETHHPGPRVVLPRLGVPQAV